MCPGASIPIYRWRQIGLRRGQYFKCRNFIKGLILSFNIRHIVNFVTDVRVEFINIHIIIAVNFFLSEYTKNDVGWGFDPDPTGELTAISSPL